MSRKIILTLATAATLVVASLASGAAEARGFGGGGGGFGGGHFAGGRIGGGNHFAARGGGGRVHPIFNPGRGGHPGHPGHPGHNLFGHHHGHHWVFRHGIWIDIDGVDGVDDVDVAPAEVSGPAPGPCTCLTKTYTPDGLVVFADVCTKEAASARVDGASSDATPVPAPAPSKASDATVVPQPQGKVAEASEAPTSQNFAGRTYQDYLAANAQAANGSAPKN